jgi:superoxide dismutase, Fe-Mn family
VRKNKKLIFAQILNLNVMSFTLPELPYSKDALEPFISKNTIEFHYGKHHQAYVNNLNGLLPGSGLENLSLEEIVIKAEGGIFNNAAQVWNHTFYWESLSPKGGGEPKGILLQKIISDFGSYQEFKEKFSKACATLFGSGWAWLIQKSEGTLDIVQESNAGNPIKRGLNPLLTCDVWEHAYYLDYQNRRPDYISAFWGIVDWSTVESRLK